MTYFDWFNGQRLHGEITNDASYATTPNTRPATTVTSPRGHGAGNPITQCTRIPGAVHSVVRGGTNQEMVPVTDPLIENVAPWRSV